MKIVGLVTEYNPFHNGHLYHLEKSKSLTNSDYSISVMSGNFVQRGEPALVDKWTRAKMAVDNGVDLVIELPVIYACQSAELFAYGAIKLLDNLGIVNFLCFGSEANDIEILDSIATILVNEPEQYQKYLKESLNKGNSFPSAREYALISYMKDLGFKNYQDLKNIMSSPNNILGIEYLKALYKINSSIVPYTIKRKGASYNNISLTGNISSATAVREEILKSTCIQVIKDAVPLSTYYQLQYFFNDNKKFNNLDNFSKIIIFLAREIGSEKLKDIMDVEDGLDNRIINCANNNTTINDMLSCISTKRYTMTRLKRILIHLLIDLDGPTFKLLHTHGPQYARLLASNRRGLELLKKAKENSNMQIITKFADYQKINNPILKQMIEFDKKSTDIYFLGLNNKNSISNLDYLTSPYIK